MTIPFNQHTKNSSGFVFFFNLMQSKLVLSLSVITEVPFAKKDNIRHTNCIFDRRIKKQFV